MQVDVNVKIIGEKQNFYQIKNPFVSEIIGDGMNICMKDFVETYGMCSFKVTVEMTTNEATILIEGE